MKKEISKIWVKALRSRKYKQGQNALLNEKGERCCLGVLCDLFNATHKRKLSVGEPEFNDNMDVICRRIDGQRETLPPKVQKWAGMRSRNGVYSGACVSLSTENDGLDLTGNVYMDDEIKAKNFQQIADIIEENYKTL